MLVNIPKKLIITDAMAIIPKSFGESNRANTAVTINEMIIPEYLAIAV